MHRRSRPSPDGPRPADERARPRSLREAFDAAVSLPPGERAAFAARECGGDPKLLERLLALLGHDGAPGPLDHPLPCATEAVEPAPGDVLGPYWVLGELGEGGFALVYLAEQSEPVRRRVALKVVRPELAGSNVLLRFELERHALERMEHPNVCRVLDAGRAALHRAPGCAFSYLAMELVDGPRITEYCRARGLPPRARLELFAQVCDGVHHAHQRGVIHRDIKPSNVLVAEVDGRAVPKVLDFGVAKLLDKEGASPGDPTRERALLGTLEYMSPEQASLSPGAPDTRTDVHALGVLLFELLTGETPHDLTGRPRSEALRVLREETPARLRRPNALLRGDLRRIVEQALRREPELRYGSASELGADVRRFLASRPIAARRPSVAYRLMRLARRHRGVAAAGALALASVVAGGGLAGHHFTQRQLEASRQRQLAAFMERLLGTAEPGAWPGPGSGEEVLARAVELLGGPPGLDPAIRARIHTVVARVLGILDRREEAVAHLRQALALREASAGSRAPETLEALGSLAAMLRRQGSYRAAMGKPGEIEGLLVEALGLSEELARRTLAAHGRASREWLFALDHLGLAQAEAGRLEQGLATLDEVAALIGEPGTQDGRRVPLVGFHRAVVLARMGRWEEADAEYARLLPLRRAACGLRDPACLAALGNRAFVLRQLDRDEESIAAYREYTELALAYPGHLGPETLNAINTLGRMEMDQGLLAESAATLRTAVRLRRRILGEEHADTLVSLNNLAATLSRAEQPVEALAVTVELARGALAAGPEVGAWHRALYLERHARALRDLGREGEAAAWFERAHAKAPLAGDRHDLAGRIAAQLAEILGELGREDEAKTWRARAPHAR